MKKTVLITGGSRGIGASTAKKFASHGYNIALTFLTNETLAKSLKEEIEKNWDVEVFLKKLDIQNETEITTWLKEVLDKFEGIDCLVNNAAICHDNNIEEKTVLEFEDVLRTNLVGPFLTCKFVGEKMLEQKSGKIINIASTNGIDTMNTYSIDYDASKAGLISLTHNFAKHLAPFVQVNAVCPGWTKTESVLEMNPNDLKKEQESILLERFAEPEEIANVIYFLATDEASYINNSILRVDGGIK